tara:strand:+ start:591 stop:944 length:354 start_codon:yes stop_codon:yes gene_type:complete
MTFYSDMAATAKDLLAEFGQDVIFDYETGATYDPVLMTEVAGTAQQITAKAYPSKFMQSEVSTTILSTDIKLVCEKTLVKPAAGWDCTLNSAKYRVMNSTSIGLTGDEVIYYVQLRK